MSAWIAHRSVLRSPSDPLSNPCQAPSLRKYRRIYKLGEVQNGGTKDELMPAVMRHWNQTIVDEDETLVAFAFALRKQATTGFGSSYGVSRTSTMKSGSSRSAKGVGKGK